MTLPEARIPVLRTDRIVKRFPGVVALKGVSFDLHAGEIHALCGENGAGKSTLIKVLSGLHPAGSYEGTIYVDGREVAFATKRDAERAGIGVICQELALVNEMTVGENIFLGAEPTTLGLFDWDRVFADARALLERFGIDIDPSARAGSLGVGRRQEVEIVKALSRNSRVLVLDEPTAALTEHEVKALLDILVDLRRRGIAMIYISHRLEEVFMIADRITVLRDGETVTTRKASETSRDEVIRTMAGRALGELFPRRAPPPGDLLLRVAGLDVARERGGAPLLRDIALEVRAGEVLGIGGLMGAGRSELLMHLFGAWGYRLRGTVELAGVALGEDGSPWRSIAAGLVLVTEDRKRYGLVLEESVGFNLSLSILERLTRRGLLDQGLEQQGNSALFDALRIKAPGLWSRVSGLSGGNQQKVVLGKALLTRPKVVLLDEPTRGIDVAAKVEAYELINQLTEEGKAVVLVSSELPELLGMSDRIMMLCEGRIGGRFARAEATQERLLAAAMGQGEA